MPPLPRTGRTLCAAALTVFVALGAAAAPAEPEPRRFETRAVHVGGALDRPDVRRHVRFTLSGGFNAVRVPSAVAASWTASDAPDGVVLRASFVEWARELSDSDARVILALEPWRDDPASWRYTDSDAIARLGRLIRIARRKAGVRDVVVSFLGAPLRLNDLDDVTEYGGLSAPAQVAVARELLRFTGKTQRLWLEPSVTTDRFLADPQLRYGRALFEALEDLDPRVGVVWGGPQPLSESITAADVTRAIERCGGRPLMLDDRYPANGSGAVIPLALVLGPLRRRESGIADRVDVYVATPMAELGASRLSLLTIGDFLTDPDGYDPDASWRRAKKRLAGDDEAAYQALRTQAAEWGGWIGTRNYHTAADENPATAAASLNDPAAFSAWVWPVRTYPERLADLAGLADTTFRDDLSLTMRRRLAVARAAPEAKKLRDPSTPPEAIPGLRRALTDQRAALRDEPDVRLALDRFLLHAGLAALVDPPESKTDDVLP